MIKLIVTSTQKTVADCITRQRPSTTTAPTSGERSNCTHTLIQKVLRAELLQKGGTAWMTGVATGYEGGCVFFSKKGGWACFQISLDQLWDLF